LPFRLLGQAQEGGQIRVFLQHGDQNLIVSTGDLIGRQYRVEHIDEQRVTFVYLPMNTVQHMALSPTSTETTK
jgi:Tfp pilus assembly protein PilP